MKLWKRNAVVAAIVLFVCVAVYLNWSYDQESASGVGQAESTSISNQEGSTKTLGEAALVNSGTQEAEETAAETGDIVLDT